jgi:anti-sigma B factor antagonist
MRTLPKENNSPAVCYFEGNLESETVAGFRALVAAMRPGQNVILDLRQVPFVDSAGLGALLGSVRRIRESGGDAIICRPRPSVRRALHLTAIDRSVGVATSIEEAERYFSGMPIAA